LQFPPLQTAPWQHFLPSPQGFPTFAQAAIAAGENRPSSPPSAPATSSPSMARRAVVSAASDIVIASNLRRST
jgi:hypothetical protein